MFYVKNGNVKKAMYSNYLLWMKIEFVWKGWHKASKKSYFHFGASSRTSSKSAKQK